MKHYKRAMSALHNVLMVLVSAGLVVMICVTAVEVVRRYLFGLSFSWAEELVKYLMIMVAFFGGAGAYQDKGLVALDMLTEKLPGNLKTAVALLAEILSVLVIALLFKYSLQAILKPGVYKQISIGLGISMAYPWASMPIGFAAMLLFSVEHFYELIAGFRRKEA